MKKNPFDRLLAQDAPQADHTAEMWGMLNSQADLKGLSAPAENGQQLGYVAHEDDEELEFHDGRSTQLRCEGVDDIRDPLQMPAKVVSLEALDDEVHVGDPRWEWT